MYSQHKFSDFCDLMKTFNTKIRYIDKSAGVF